MFEGSFDQFKRTFSILNARTPLQLLQLLCLFQFADLFADVQPLGIQDSGADGDSAESNQVSQAPVQNGGPKLVCRI